MAYCDAEYYKDTYGGQAIPDDDLEKALADASRAIDCATMYRIGELDDWSAFTQAQVKLATCAQADHAYKYGELESVSSAIGGYSIGDVSVTGKADGGKSALEQHYKLCEAAIRLLMPTGLLDRRLR
jgi:hypothetical protein